jgi:hypothetical protein
MDKHVAPMPEMVLNLEELLPDDEGNVFISSYDDVQLRIVTHEPVAESGTMPNATEGASPEVLQYFLFESGTKLLYGEHDSVVLDVLV